MGLLKKKIGKQGRWPNALGIFFLPIFLIFAVRWFFYEPFVIPSESMVPNLYVHDHILVKKYSYGLKMPFGDGWLWKWREPQRGDVVVFRFPENRDVFYIKRLIGLPGDKIQAKGKNLSVNGQLYQLRKDTFNLENDYTYIENNGEKSYVVQFAPGTGFNQDDEETFEVPPKSYFMMGDNRFSSHDSRFWGYVPEDLLIGRAQIIWLSCENTLVSAPFVCDPASLRPHRFFSTIE